MKLTPGIGYLESDHGEGNGIENLKEALGLVSRQHFFKNTFLYRHCTTRTWNFLMRRFYDDNFFFLFQNLVAKVLKNSTPGKFNVLSELD